MDLIYPINFVGHEECLKSGFALDLAVGEVITMDGEVLGTWRAVGYDPEAEDEGGHYEFVTDGPDAVMFREVCSSRLSDEPRPCVVNAQESDKEMARSSILLGYQNL